MKGHGTQFARKQEEAIAALLTQRNIDEAAKAVGIAPNTLVKWMKDPGFYAAYRDARRLAFRQSPSLRASPLRGIPNSAAGRRSCAPATASSSIGSTAYRRSATLYRA